MEFKHYSVLLNETIEQLHIKPDGIYVDGTLGGGGHSLEICKRLTTGRLVGIDQDAGQARRVGIGCHALVGEGGGENLG